MKHPIHIKGYDYLEDLAEDIGNLRYDALADVLLYLSNKLRKDYDADRKRGYADLSEELFKQSACFLEAHEAAVKAWKISQPKMKPEDLVMDYNYPSIKEMIKYGKRVDPRDVGMVLSSETPHVWVYKGFAARSGTWSSAIIPLDDNGMVISEAGRITRSEDSYVYNAKGVIIGKIEDLSEAFETIEKHDIKPETVYILDTEEGVEGLRKFPNI